jgi:histidine triad (HIT) family protein
MDNYSGTDIYCDLIVPKHLPVHIIKETDHVLVFHLTKPHWPTHIVAVPKVHIPSLLELPSDIAAELLTVVKEIASMANNKTGGCRVLTGIGEYQTSKHLHVHINSDKPLA